MESPASGTFEQRIALQLGSQQLVIAKLQASLQAANAEVARLAADNAAKAQEIEVLKRERSAANDDAA